MHGAWSATVLCCFPCVRMRLRGLKWIISKKASSLSVPKNVLSFTSLDIKQMNAETLYTRLFLCSQLVCYDGSVGLLHAGRMQHAWFAWQQQLYILFCPTWRTHLFNFLYFKRQRCRTSLLIFSFFILSPSLLCVCISFPNSHCLFYVFWIYFCLHLHLTDGFDSVPFHRVCN